MEFISEYWQVFLTVFVVLLALLVILLVARRWGRRIGTGGGARLAVTEVEAVDQTRRLVLVRRDSVEHLLMIGGPQDVVVETNIARSGAGMGRDDEPPVRREREFVPPEPYRAPEPAMSRREAPGAQQHSEPPLFGGYGAARGSDDAAAMRPPEPPAVEPASGYGDTPPPYPRSGARTHESGSVPDPRSIRPAETTRDDDSDRY